MLAAAVVAAVVAVIQGGTEPAPALAEADSTVLLRTTDGEVAHQIPVRQTEFARFGAGSIWTVSSEGELVRIHPGSGAVIATIGLGVEPSGVVFGEGSLWVTGKHSPTLFRIDPSVNEVVERFSLPMQGVETDLTGEVAVGAGSVWVGHGAYNPGAWVERVDPDTGRVQRRFSILAGDVDHLAFGQGALWVASTPSGELRKIDPRTNDVVLTRTLQADLCCVAAGGGYVWAATNPSGDVWKLTSDGKLLPTIKLSSAIERLTYADGALWATLGGNGTVVRIDPTTDAIRRYHVGHFATAVDVRDGLLAVGVRKSAEDETADLEGDIVWVGRKARTLFDSGAATDPAFTAPTWDAPQMQFHFATCARLLNYADAEGDAGKRLVPEVAEDFPNVSDGGRTYTFEIRDGFGFSPTVDGEGDRRVVPACARARPVAEVRLRGTRDAEHRWRRGIPSGPSGPHFRRLGGGARARRAAARARSGVSVARRANLRRSAYDAGRTQRCESTRPLRGALLSRGARRLLRGPQAKSELRGRRPQHLDVIVFKFNIAPGQAASQIENDTLDYFLESQAPVLRPDTVAARAAGERYLLTRASNAGCSSSSSTSIGRSSRTFVCVTPCGTRSTEWRSQTRATRLVIPPHVWLSMGVQGMTRHRCIRSVGTCGELGKLRLGRNTGGPSTTWDDPPYTDAFNRVLRERLAAIGIRVTVAPNRPGQGVQPQRLKGRPDLGWSNRKHG